MTERMTLDLIGSQVAGRRPEDDITSMLNLSKSKRSATEERCSRPR
jgi:hypothetical protein